MSNRVRLSVAAARLGLSYGQALRLVMVRQLAGGQDEKTRRWWVEEHDLERMERAVGTAKR